MLQNWKVLRASTKSGLTCHWLKAPPLLYCCAGSLQCVVRCKPTGPQIRLYGHCIHCIYHQSLPALQSTHAWSIRIYISARWPFEATSSVWLCTCTKGCKDIFSCLLCMELQIGLRLANTRDSRPQPDVQSGQTASPNVILRIWHTALLHAV